MEISCPHHRLRANFTTPYGTDQVDVFRLAAFWRNLPLPSRRVRHALIAGDWPSAWLRDHQGLKDHGISGG
jgi:hypothetical protein